MIRRVVCALCLVATVLAAGPADAGKDRPHVNVPEPSNGQMCVEVFFDDVSQTICIPAPS